MGRRLIPNWSDSRLIFGSTLTPLFAVACLDRPGLASYCNDSAPRRPTPPCSPPRLPSTASVPMDT